MLLVDARDGALGIACKSLSPPDGQRRRLTHLRTSHLTPQPSRQHSTDGAVRYSANSSPDELDKKTGISVTGERPNSPLH